MLKESLKGVQDVHEYISYLEKSTVRSISFSICITGILFFRTTCIWKHSNCWNLGRNELVRSATQRKNVCSGSYDEPNAFRMEFREADTASAINNAAVQGV
jgi:hypothetical protein